MRVAINMSMFRIATQTSSMCQWRRCLYIVSFTTNSERYAFISRFNIAKLPKAAIQNSLGNFDLEALGLKFWFIIINCRVPRTGSPIRTKSKYSSLSGTPILNEIQVCLSVNANHQLLKISNCPTYKCQIHFSLVQ